MKVEKPGVHIKAKDFSQSLAFYQNLGFNLVFRYGPDQEVKEDYQGATFEVGSMLLEIADGHRGVKPATFQENVTSSKISLMIQVDSIIDLIRLCQEKGIPLAVGPRHYYWGKLEVVIKDPDGVVLVFTQPYSEEAAQILKADETWGKPPQN